MRMSQSQGSPSTSVQGMLILKLVSGNSSLEPIKVTAVYLSMSLARRMTETPISGISVNFRAKLMLR